MLSLCILLFTIVLLTAAVSYWLADTPIAAVLRFIYSLVVALIIISILYDASLVLCFSFWWSIALSILMSVCLIYYSQRYRERSFLQALPVISLRSSIYPVIALALICYLSYMFIPHSGRWGRWDAKAIWTLHALFLADHHHWSSLFSPAIAWTHADYPLLLPSVTAMLWATIGIPEPLIPCIIAYLVFIAVLIVVYTSLAQNRKQLLGILGLLVFITSIPYARAAAYQCADTPLSLFILLALVLSRLSERSSNIKLTVLTGFIVGFSGWIKNEGIAFIIVFSLFYIWRNRKNAGSIYYCVGLIFPLLVIGVFKFLYAPSNDIVNGQGATTLSKLADISRYKLTSKFFFDYILQFYPALMIITTFVIVSGYRKLWDHQLAILIAMIFVYYFIFIVTPRDLQWHLETALERLFMQLFPSFVFVLLYLAGGSRSRSPVRHTL